MSIRILHILDHSLPIHSGYAFRSDAIRREQTALGWDTHWLTTPKQGSSTASDELVDGKRYFRTLGGVDAGLLGQMKATAARLSRLVEELEPDVIQAHSPVLNVLPALWIRRRYNIPVVYERRSSWEDAAATRGTSRHGGPRYQASRLLETLAFRQADAITTICAGLKNDITARGIDPSKVTLIPNGVDPDLFPVDSAPDQRLVDELNLRGATVLGYAGSFSPYEGLELLLEAVGRVLPQCPALKVLLIGAGGNEHELRAMTKQLNLQDHVIFTGRVEHAQIQRYYSVVDVFVYPRMSTRLTNMVTPLKPLEAMAAGRLVLASDVGGHQELIEHQKTGILFKANDAGSLADEIVKLVTDRAAWPMLRHTGRQFVETERTWTRGVSGYREVYERLVSLTAAQALAQK
ncbi:MAG: TIGR04063 family PEP-CTERM/XrtA system glycosyltransferase [Burkholderiaceae bacterium]